MSEDFGPRFISEHGLKRGKAESSGRAGEEMAAVDHGHITPGDRCEFRSGGFFGVRLASDHDIVGDYLC
jgi:hypothetical protein